MRLKVWGATRLVLDERACAHCRKTVVVHAGNPGQKFCSKSCAKRFGALSISEARTAEVLGRYEGTEPVVAIQLGQGRAVLIDRADLALVAPFAWSAARRGVNWYVRANVRRPDGSRTTRWMHQLLCPVPDGMEVDHVNGNGLDNRRANLRPATRTQNRANQRRVSGRSGVKGVYWHKRDCVWQAAIAGKHLGYFTRREDAEKAYKAAAVQLYGEFAEKESVS